MSENAYIEYAKRELAILDMTPDEDGINGWMAKHLLDMVKAFSEAGHSGATAHYAARALSKLFLFEPLTPLTGADDEWGDTGHGLQNKRAFSVFKDRRFDGKPYQSDYYIFRYPDGCCVMRFGSERVIESFPYTPGHEYIDVDADGEALK